MNYEQYYFPLRINQLSVTQGPKKRGAMDRLTEFESFLRVAQSGSFTAAARGLGVTASAISKQIKALEERLDVRLLNRTTRRVSLTDEGRAFADRVATILGDVAEAESAVTAAVSEPSGRLRLGAPMDFGRIHLADAIAGFAAAHPRVDVEVVLTDRFVDVVGEGFDVVVRIGELDDSSLISRRIAPCRRVICASPDYLAAHGHPRSFEALSEHRRIGYEFESSHAWDFDTDTGPVRVEVPVGHRSNNGEMTSAMLRAGLGIALLPTFLVFDELRQGSLVPLLATELRNAIPIHTVYPHRRHLSAKVRTFVDHLADHCGDVPFWDVGLGF